MNYLHTPYVLGGTVADNIKNLIANGATIFRPRITPGTKIGTKNAIGCCVGIVDSFKNFNGGAHACIGGHF